MKRLAITSAILTALLYTLVLQGIHAEEKKPDNFLPRIGSLYVLETEIYIIRGAGNTLYHYTSTGVKLEVKILNLPGTITISPKKGEKVRIDPTIPMVYVGGKKHEEFETNNFLKTKAKGAIFLLLELKS